MHAFEVINHSNIKILLFTDPSVVDCQDSQNKNASLNENSPIIQIKCDLWCRFGIIVFQNNQEPMAFEVSDDA